MPKTFTFGLFLLLLAGSGVSFYWLANGGASDGADYIAYGCLAVAAIVAILSRVLGGAWFTDNANGH